MPQTSAQGEIPDPKTFCMQHFACFDCVKSFLCGVKSNAPPQKLRSHPVGPCSNKQLSDLQGGTWAGAVPARCTTVKSPLELEWGRRTTWGMPRLPAAVRALSPCSPSSVSTSCTSAWRPRTFPEPTSGKKISCWRWMSCLQITFHHLSSLPATIGS